MRPMRVLAAAVAFMTVLFLSCYVYMARYDYNDLKPTIVQAVKTATGRELTLSGPIALKIGFSPALVTEGVRFQNASWGSRPLSVKIGRLELKVSLLSLMFGEIRIKRLLLVDSDVLIETDSSGRSNFSFWSKRAESAGGGEGFPPIAFNSLEVLNGHIRYGDGPTGKRHDLMVDRFSAAAEKGENRVKIAFKGTYDGKGFTVGGTIDDPWALADPGSISSFHFRAQTAGTLFIFSGTIRDVFGLNGFSALIECKGESTRDLESFLGRTGLPDVPFRLSVQVTGRREKLSVKRCEVRVGSHVWMECRADGTLESLKRGAGARGEFRIAARGGSAESLDLDVGGSVEVFLSPGKQPRFKAVLSSGKIDLTPFLNEEKGKERVPRVESAEHKVFSQRPIPFRSLPRVDADVRLRAGRVLFPKVSCEDLSVRLSLKGGRLSIQALTLRLGGGVFTGKFLFERRGEGGIIEAKCKVDDFDLGRMLKDLEIDGGIEGRVHAEMEMRGVGGSVAEIMGGLEGKAKVMTGKGRLDNRYIDMLGADLSSNIFRLLNPFRKGSAYTEFDCIVSLFAIEGGVAESRALVFNGSRMIVAGEGEVDLKEETLDFSLKPSPKKGVGLQGLGKMSLSLGQLTRPFKLGGTLADPSLTIDPAETVITLGKAIGGVVLFGPLGVAAALAGWDSNEKNPCVCAIESAEKESRQKGDEQKGAIEKAAQGITNGIGEAVEGVGRSLRGVFAR